MIVGVPKEIKDQEKRVAIAPAGAGMLAAEGHRVLVERGAGLGSGIADEAYEKAGARIADDAAEVWAAADLVMKVKEPQPAEWPLVREGQTLFTYFHFASSRELTDAMLASGADCVAYETVEAPGRRGSHPLLTPMSEIAGRLSAQQGAKYLESPSGGRGTLMGGVPGVKPARVMVLGGGIVGYDAARVAAGMGARVTILDIDLERLRHIDEVGPRNVSTLYCSRHNILEQLPGADVVIGSVYVSGSLAPRLVRREDLSLLPRGAVLVDVAIDQGGCFESSRPTSHSDPVFVEEGVIHYCVTNMPGAVARTSTYALTNATAPYALRIARGGWREAARQDPGLAAGVNVAGGKLVCAGVAEAFGMESVPVAKVLGA